MNLQRETSCQNVCSAKFGGRAIRTATYRDGTGGGLMSAYDSKTGILQGEEGFRI
jgi:hypothetical protein